MWGILTLLGLAYSCSSLVTNDNVFYKQTTKSSSRPIRYQHGRDVSHVRQHAASSAWTQERRPLPPMPSQLFQDLALSQLELLASSLNTVKSMALYLPQENAQTGALEFLPVVCYPRSDRQRVFIASSAADARPPTLPRTLSTLPGFAHASYLLPGYPLVSSVNGNDPTSTVEEVLCDIRIGGATSLSVPLTNGPVTVGALLVSPCAGTVWHTKDKTAVAKAAQSLSLALQMDQERNALKSKQDGVSRALADSIHQVKNPLQALRTFGKLLQRRLADEDEELLELTQHILEQSDRLVDRLEPVDRILDELENFPPLLVPAESSVLQGQPPSEQALSESPRSSSGELTEESMMVFIPDILEPVVAAFAALAMEHDMDFHVQQEADLPGVHAQPRALQEAVSNVLDNAFHYASLSKSKAQVRLKVSSVDNPIGVRLWVQDSGPGIPVDEWELIFDRGYRGKTTRGMVSGSGIGLAIARTLVERQRGHIAVVDTNDERMATTLEMVFPR